MNVNDWLLEKTGNLAKAGIPTARLDCLILLEDATEKNRSWLLAHPDHVLQGRFLQKLDKQVERRMKHEPLAYIRGKSEFYGREFKVNADTLQPRPETETMIELLKEFIQNQQNPSLLEVRPLTDGINARFLVVDVGTGSGCLAITAKLELPNAEVIGSDISPACLKIAKQNAIRLNAEVEFLHGDLLQPLSPPTSHLLPSIILANLPYVPDGHTINQAAMFEPKIAIFGGSDGLDFYRRLFEQVAKLPFKPKYILSESLPFQHAELAEIAVSKHYKLIKTTDFIQVFQQISH